MIRVVLPYHLRNLARVEGELTLDLGETAPTLGQVLDTIEARHPALRGTIRDRATLQRRPFVRFYACSEDLSFAKYDTLLPTPIKEGHEPLIIMGAMAGG
ncbi:MoaD/ThiS family protein [soil metagenome]